MAEFKNVVYNSFGTPLAGFLTHFEAIDYADNRFKIMGENNMVLSIAGIGSFMPEYNLSFRDQYDEVILNLLAEA